MTGLLASGVKLAKLFKPTGAVALLLAVLWWKRLTDEKPKVDRAS